MAPDSGRTPLKPQKKSFISHWFCGGKMKIFFKLPPEARNKDRFVHQGVGVGLNVLRGGGPRFNNHVTSSTCCGAGSCYAHHSRSIY